jgi:hypothetical protein
VHDKLEARHESTERPLVVTESVMQSMLSWVLRLFDVPMLGLPACWPAALICRMQKLGRFADGGRLPSNAHANDPLPD